MGISQGMRGALFLALAFVHSASALNEPLTKFTEDSGVAPGVSGEVWPLNDIQLLQTAGTMAKENNALQTTLATDAEKKHATKLEMQTTAQTAEAKFKAADALAQQATKKALDTTDPDDADAAVTKKQDAAAAKAQHTKAKSDFSAAQVQADEALKKAQAAGAIVNLPSAAAAPAPAPAAAVTTPAPAAAVATPAPAVKAPPLQVQPTKLEKLLQERRVKRLKEEAQDLKKKIRGSQS